jgi:hypothetical protein
MANETKYPWKDAPEWAQWAAKNTNGRSLWFEFKPEFIWVFWIDNCDGMESLLSNGQRITPNEAELSLEKRPTNE